MPTPEERSLARRLFKCRLIMCHAKAFQDLFWDLMKAKHGQEFAPVAPQGRKGDGGNDGYLPKSKHYFQLFAPVEPNEKVVTAAAKLADDFDKVNNQWAKPNGAGILTYSFAFNDKYEGAPKDIELALNALRTKHSSVSFHHYCCRDAENDFISLPENQWDLLLGASVPDPAKITAIDYSVLNEVIVAIMNADAHAADGRLSLPPELDDKIKLNKLTKANAVRIQNGALNTGHIERFLKANSTFAITELRDHVVGIYETAKTVVLVDPSQQTAVADELFTVFRRALFPKGATAQAAVAVDAVIGYFFEACDVFDPHAQKGDLGASP